jgi:hypothetical protein
VEFGDKSHHPRLRADHLDVRAQAFHFPGRQGDIVLVAQFEDCPQADIAVQMAM